MRWKAENIECEVTKHPDLGYFIGEVKLPKNHRHVGEWHADLCLEYVVHGGITISHEKNGEWWIGFDCCHVGDWLPCSRFAPAITETVWTEEAAIRETESLAKQVVGYSHLKMTENAS